LLHWSCFGRRLVGVTDCCPTCQKVQQLIERATPEYGSGSPSAQGMARSISPIGSAVLAHDRCLHRRRLLPDSGVGCTLAARSFWKAMDESCGRGSHGWRGWGHHCPGSIGQGQGQLPLADCRFTHRFHPEGARSIESGGCGRQSCCRGER